MRTIAFANLKPGTGKTTTTILLAYGLHRRGFDVAVADCDPAQSALAWSDAVSGFPFPIYGLPVKDAGKRLVDIGGEKAWVVVDLPQAEDHAQIVRSVLRRVDEITVPVAPTPIEVERMSGISDLLEEIDEVRQTPARTAVLLNRVVGGARSGGDARAGLTELGYEVLVPEIPRREVYALAYGAVPAIRDGDPIDQLVDTYLERAGVTA
ncbi:AAA family ATPase [Marinactinospora rubrisoli]|uniref:AAA family ATPase n=1 Tax=Marinactinospora rubrisoli TaxID=2715399 RepID=A0ABW2KQE2_9ACTN